MIECTFVEFALRLRELQVMFEMPGLGIQQPRIELAQFFRQMRQECGKALARSSFDQGANQLQIQQSFRFMIAHSIAQ